MLICEFLSFLKCLLNVIVLMNVSGILGMAGGNSYFYAAIVAIVVVHVILACFIYVAFTEDDTPRPQFKQD